MSTLVFPSVSVQLSQDHDFIEPKLADHAGATASPLQVLREEIKELATPTSDNEKNRPSQELQQPTLPFILEEDEDEQLGLLQLPGQLLVQQGGATRAAFFDEVDDLNKNASGIPFLPPLRRTHGAPKLFSSDGTVSETPASCPGSFPPNNTYNALQ